MSRELEREKSGLEKMQERTQNRVSPEKAKDNQGEIVRAFEKERASAVQREKGDLDFDKKYDLYLKQDEIAKGKLDKIYEPMEKANELGKKSLKRTNDEIAKGKQAENDYRKGVKLYEKK